ncbi:dethiobiotin synthase [Methylocaldum szegediense]|jgi:dethiobiotin synthetase|uniref:ATP-dependent dethiobiotin synthetase BioD n=1 Tax=Methylocaldum szegediense TaxID=73780 RepID=A0ABM9I1U6_9GAMM|nr:dethiobiotin synthase [Methylocaldum szegediense]CAI8833686.1 dethiobiotin synthetase [Methylocaldum szegediense]
MSLKARGIFVTGTDTGIGKTLVSVGLMRLLRTTGLKVAGMKPVATGASGLNGHLVNEDALLLQANASIPLDYSQVNPFVFELPVSPHLAAKKAGRDIDLQCIRQVYDELNEVADCVVVEGVGGWEVLLNERERVADLVRMLDLPVLLVVGLRLGCLNHALLTGHAITHAGVRCIGWVANQVDRDYPLLAENIETLEKAFDWPLLTVVPFYDDPAKHWDIFPTERKDNVLRVLCS